MYNIPGSFRRNKTTKKRMIHFSVTLIMAQYKPEPNVEASIKTHDPCLSDDDHDTIQATNTLK